MRYLILAALCLAITNSALSSRALSQEQQAGNAASTNADKTFQELVAKCNDTDVLMLRARIRLVLGRTTEKAVKEGSALLRTGMTSCGEGKIEEAKATLTKAYAVVNAGATEKFGQDASAKVKAAPEKRPEATKASAKAETKKPWWKFW
jgi:hypothetical protein